MAGLPQASGNGRPPLAGVRVLDLTWALAGPYGVLQLALLGAEVIKIESATSLDAIRRGSYVLSPNDLERSPTFSNSNLNKLSLRLNLKHPEGLKLFKKLAKASDVVVENFRPGVLERLGLGYDTLRADNPTIILASSSSFGGTGPESRRPGYAPIFQATSSLGNLTGYEDGPPAEMRESIDLRVGAALAYAVLLAIFHRRRTGRGQSIDLSSMEAMISLVGHTLVGYQMTGQVAHRRGNADAVLAPHGIYPCSVLPGKKQDRSGQAEAWVSIAVGSDGEFQALCRAIGRPELANDPRFVDLFQRRRHAEELDGEMRAWTCRRTPQEVTRVLQEAGVAALPVFTNKELFEDPHPIARGVWREVTHPVLGKQTVQGLPWKSSNAASTPLRPGPLLGQHNGYALEEVLGLPPQEIERLAEAGVFH